MVTLTSLFTLAVVFCISCDVCSALDYLSSGFAHVKLNDGRNTRETFLIEDSYRVPVSVETFEFNHIPPYVKEKNFSPFTLMKGKLINEKQVFYNGEYYIFFLSNTEPHGTWLLGDQLGVDSGIAYLRPDVHTLVPVDMESAKTSWSFLKDGKWVVESEVRVVVGEPGYTQSGESDSDGGVTEGIVDRVQYHSISYYVQEVCTPSILLMTPINTVQAMDSTQFFHFSSALTLPLPQGSWRLDQYPLFWNLQTKEWTSLTLDFVIPRGTPVRLIENKNKNTDEGDDSTSKSKSGTDLMQKRDKEQGSSSQIVQLVGNEQEGNGWRLFLRVAGKDAGSALEMKLSLSKTGLPSHFKIKSLKKNHMNSHVKKQNQKIMLLEEGSYLWLWFHAEPRTVGESSYLTLASGDFLLKCIGKSATPGAERYVFEYHHSHRRVAMDRSVLSLTTSLITATWNQDINALEWSLDGAPLLVDAIFTLGPDPVSWLRDYLMAHENFLAPGLSSCFMYHGGLSMPQQLIYAAEVVCVLIGAKPMTMIQYTSSADHQWKFPLVPELTKALIAGRLLLPALSSPSTGVDVQLNTYQVTSETVIFYRPKQRPMLHLLRPNQTAQALHIVPFPSEAGEGEGNAVKMNIILREQIYNSWWNGYLLGYPVRFVDSYLRSFHTKLSAEGIGQEIQRAQRDVEKYFQQHRHDLPLQRGEIGLGGDVDLLAEKEVLLYFAKSVV